MSSKDIIQEKFLDGYSKSMSIEAMKIVFHQMENSICHITNNGLKGLVFFVFFKMMMHGIQLRSES